MISILAGEKEAGSRIDRVLRKRLPLVSLAGIYSLIRLGGVRVAGKKRVGQDYRLIAGDRIEIDLDPAELAVPRTQSAADKCLVNTEFFRRNFSILHEDGDLLACNKPAGLVVHPGSGHLQHDTLIDLAVAYLLAGDAAATADDIGLVHRLDRDTSGVILVAKNKPALRRLHESFRDRSLVKRYIALCHGRPPKNEGEVTVNLRRGRDLRGETTMRVDTAGDFSRSRYRIDAFHDDISRVEVLLETGRTHQIRLHLPHIGAPIIGDGRYGDGSRDAAFFSKHPRLPKRLYLHAWKLAIPHPSGRRTITMTAPVPPEFAEAIAEVFGTTVNCPGRGERTP